MFNKSEKFSYIQEEVKSVRRRHKGTFVGTRDFLSPEMVGDYSISGPFTDIWALGIICYMLYTGKSPWVGVSNDQILDEIAQGSSNIKYP